MSKEIGRRQFIKKSTTAAALAPAIRVVKGSHNSAVAPSDQVRLGILGTGRQGMYNMQKFMEHPECQVIAVCDVYEPHLRRAQEQTSAKPFSDFRKVIDRDDIDALVISTPDHWHALMTVMGCQAGKDVYVEKPISVAVAEGRKMVEAARQYRRVVQVGTQQRSGLHFQHAVKLVQQGELGEVAAVRTWNFGNSSPQGIGNPPDSDPPGDLDWDMWLGPAPKVPFNPNRFGVFENNWSYFRWFWDYAGGMMTDWGVHLLDIVQWAMKVDAPEKISASGDKFVLRDNRETPDTLMATYRYPGFICTYENRTSNGHPINDRSYGIEFYGTKGTMSLNRQGFEITPEFSGRGEESVPRMYSMQAEDVNDSNHDHVRNFLDCMKTRENPISDIEIGHRSTTSCLLANIALRTGRQIRWDGTSERILNDDQANQWLGRPYRKPWKLHV
jgi:predicted dehydrogenase